MHQNQQMLEFDFYLLKYLHTTYYFRQKTQDSFRNPFLSFVKGYFIKFNVQSSFIFLLQQDLNTNLHLRNFHINNYILICDYQLK